MPASAPITARVARYLLGLALGLCLVSSAEGRAAETREASAAARFAQLSPAQKEQLRTRLRELKAMSPAAREQLRARFERWQKLPLAQKARVQAALERLSALPPGTQASLRARAEQLQRLPAGQQAEARQELREHAGVARHERPAADSGKRERTREQVRERRDEVRERRHRR